MRVSCPVCGSVPARRWRSEGPYQVVRCSRCGLGITWPPPSEEQLAEFYQGDYYHRHGMGDAGAAGWWERSEGILGRVPAELRRVLDVGAGQGHLVAALRARGIHADGVEPLESGRHAARSRYGLSLFDSWPAPEAEPYDLVTLVHSLEHVRDPLAVVTAASRQVRKGGFLFVDVPHAGSVELLRPARRRAILALPGHLFHFTPKSLAILIDRAGWDVRAVHLFNPDFLEWAFALRARVRRVPEPTEAPVEIASPAGEAPCAPPSPMQPTWHRLLPGLRSLFPGYRFETVAQLRAPSTLDRRQSS